VGCYIYRSRKATMENSNESNLAIADVSIQEKAV
jgi:hypothetical protein